DELSDFLTELLISAGPDGIGLVPLELQPLVVGVIRLFSVRAEVMNVCIKLDAPPALPPVWGNAPLLRQVVMNLVKNALEAMPEGGLLRVTLLSPSRDTVRMEVADTGRGIPKTDRKSTRLNSSHVKTSYAVFCLNKKQWRGTCHPT